MPDATTTITSHHRHDISDRAREILESAPLAKSVARPKTTAAASTQHFERFALPPWRDLPPDYGSAAVPAVTSIRAGIP